MEGWNGEIGHARWWARALGCALLLGVILGIVGPFGSYLNGDVLVRVAHWTGMLLVGTTFAGLLVPLAVRLGVRTGLPRAFGLGLGLLVAAIPTSAVSAFAARTLWPWQTAKLRPVDWYAQTLLIELCVVALWLTLEVARGQLASRSAGLVAPNTRDQPAPTQADPVLCLEMEDHYVRVHRASGSTLELLTLADAIDRYGSSDGLQVHRSWWVASDAIDAGERDGRNWRLRLINGDRVPVARNRVVEARSRGWLD